MEHHQPAWRVHRISALIMLAAILFYLFFQVNKRQPFVDFNPSANDPYDAVGSIAIQAALLVSLLTYSRALRWRFELEQHIKAPLILHGNILVLASMLITLLTDLTAQLVTPAPVSSLATLLRLELAAMFLLSIVCAFLLWLVYKSFSSSQPPQDLTPADAIDDLWSLVRLPVMHTKMKLPSRAFASITHFNSDILFKNIPWLNPRLYPWRFTCVAGLLVGILLMLASLQEGLPPSLGIGMLLFAIYISVELSAILIGFLVFGGYLGLRPALRHKRSVIV